MNIPNRLSLLRIILVPFMVFFYLASFIPNGWGKIVALIIFILAAVTDAIDGWYARKYNQITDLGKFLDPIADKLLVVGSLLLFVCDGTIPAPYGVIIAIIIIGRELIISAFRQIAATKKVVMAADWWGKIKTIVTDISLPALFLLSFFYSNGCVTGDWLLAFEIINYILIGLATALTIASAVNYLAKNWKVLK